MPTRTKISSKNKNPSQNSTTTTTSTIGNKRAINGGASSSRRPKKKRIANTFDHFKKLMNIGNFPNTESAKKIIEAAKRAFLASDKHMEILKGEIEKRKEKVKRNRKEKKKQKQRNLNHSMQITPDGAKDGGLTICAVKRSHIAFKPVAIAAYTDIKIRYELPKVVNFPSEGLENNFHLQISMKRATISDVKQQFNLLKSNFLNCHINDFENELVGNNNANLGFICIKDNNNDVVSTILFMVHYSAGKLTFFIEIIRACTKLSCRNRGYMAILMAILRNIKDENEKRPKLIHAFILASTVEFYTNDKIGFDKGRKFGYRDPGNTSPGIFSGVGRKDLKHYAIPEKKIVDLAKKYPPQEILKHYVTICEEVNLSNNR
jgi:hypothetical protein